MSIEKFRPTYTEGKITHEPKPFTMILNRVLQNCTRPELIGVWCYLQSLPENWTVSPQHLMNHFGFKKEKCYKIFDLLICSHLLRHDRHRDNKGRLQESNYVVLNGENFINVVESEKYKKKSIPVDNSPLPENQEMDNHHILKNPNMDKSNATKENTKLTKKNKSNSRLSVVKNQKAHPFPDDPLDVVSQRAIEIAQSKGLDYRPVLAGFHGYCLKHNWRVANWQVAFEKWVENERIPENRNQLISTVREWKPGNPDYDRFHA